MDISNLHILLSLRCPYECDHCFVWSTPSITGDLSLQDIREILHQAADVESIKTVLFEGGEPFMFYPILLSAADSAADLGFKVEILSNAYWANSEDDAAEWLGALKRAGVNGVFFSADYYHGEGVEMQRVRNAVKACKRLHIPTKTAQTLGMSPRERKRFRCRNVLAEAWDIRFRGRATTLAGGRRKRTWRLCNECLYADLNRPAEKFTLANPGRIHIAPGGYVYLCEGLNIGRLDRQPLKDMLESYDPEKHPIITPLVEGGPAQLVDKYKVPHSARYADACHLCYEARKYLRTRFPELLGPSQMYGEAGPVKQ